MACEGYLAVFSFSDTAQIIIFLLLHRYNPIHSEEILTWGSSLGYALIYIDFGKTILL